MIKTSKLNEGNWINTNRVILDAFRRDTSSQLTMSERLEEKILLSDKRIVSMDDLIVIAAMLGVLLSSEGQVTIGIHTSGLSANLEVDTSKLSDERDFCTLVMDKYHEVEQTRDNVMVISDIAVVDEATIPPKESPIWLLLQDDRCVLSVRADYIEPGMFEHLCKVTAFAGERVFNYKRSPEADTLPVHAKYEVYQRESIVKRIYRHRQEKPLDVAIIDDTSGKILTYDELWNESGAVMQQVCEQVNTNQSYPRLALFMERGWEHLVSVIAIQRLGGTCVLVDITHPDDRLQDFLDQTRPDAIITVGRTAKRVHHLVDYPVLDFDNRVIWKQQNNRKYSEWIETDNEVNFIAGTSGSTGRPKAACLSYRGMNATIDVIINAANLGEETKGTWLSSPGYGMIEVDPLPVLCAGGTVCIPAVEVMQDIKTLADWFARNNITHTLVMTSIAETLWANGLHTDLHTMLIAGERCKRWPTVEYRVLNVYGSAEAAVVSIEELSGSRRTLLPTVGRAVPGANMYIVDSSGRELPACCVGELVITGETLSKGYIDDNETQKSFRPNILDVSSTLQYSSGDRARMGLDGTVEIFGRTDALVKIRGHRVDLAEVEITALKVPGVVKAAAVCFSDNAGAILELFIESDSKMNNVKEEVFRYLREKLNPAAWPSQIHLLELPLGHNGKVDYAALRVRSADLETIYATFCPTTKTELALRDCWLSWTRREDVTLESDFFDSGGDSLRAMRMIGELNQKYGIHIEMNAFYEQPLFSNLMRLADSSHAIDLPIFENLPAMQQSESFELNEYQQALWIGRGADFHYGCVGCQGYFEWEAQAIDRERFSRAISMLVDRHPMLRVTIDEAGFQRVGVVDGSQAVEFLDLSKLSLNEIENELNKIRFHMANDKIEVEKWPLFRFVVSRINAQTSRIHFCIDLLIADAWSIFQIIIPDLIDLYFNEQTQLPMLKTTFHDYLAYRKRVKQSAQYHVHREYWLQKIHELPAAPKLPRLVKEEKAVPARFERYESVLAEEPWSSLKAQAGKRRISPSGVVALIFCEVLSCWSEEDQFTLNFPISDRMPVSDDIDLVVGDFTNILLVPYEPDFGDTLQARGQRLQDAIWQALDYRLFTGVEVLRELSRIHRTGGEPLMPIVLTSLLGHPGRHDASQLGREIFGVSQTPQVTLDVQVRESEGILYFKWDYLKGVIRPDVIKAMFDLFCKLLLQLSNDPDIWGNTEIGEHCRPNGEIEDLGRSRRKRSTNLFGEIEILATSCKGVMKAHAFSLFDFNGRSKQIVLVYTGEADLESNIEKKLSSCLPNDTVPIIIQKVSQLPLTINGKVDVKNLREDILRRINMNELNKENKQRILKQIIQVLSERLSQPVVLLEDNFYDLGGDSLAAMKIKEDLESQLTTTISIETIMLTDTVGEFANDLVESVLQ